MNEELKTKLKELGLTDEQVDKINASGGTTGVTESDITNLTPAELVEVSGCGLIVAKKVAVSFAPPPPSPEENGNAAERVTNVLLAKVPDDESLLKELLVGGVARVGQTDVNSVVRAAIDRKLGLYDILPLLRDRMEEHAEKQAVPVGEDFYELEEMITRREYGNLFAAFKGVNGNFVSAARRKRILDRADTVLWQGLADFHAELKSWYTLWTQGTASPLAFIAAQNAGKTPGFVVPPGMMQPPETTGLRDSARAVIDKINAVFAGTGIPVARALAFDSIRIRKILREPNLPYALGFTTKEEMLRELHINVAFADDRLETSVVCYVLSLMDLNDITPGDAEYYYLGSLYLLGETIHFEKLLRPSLRDDVDSGKRAKKEETPIPGNGFRRSEGDVEMQPVTRRPQPY